MIWRQPKRAMHQRAVIFAAVIFKPSGVRRVLVQVLRVNVMVLATHHTTQVREKGDVPVNVEIGGQALLTLSL